MWIKAKSGKAAMNADRATEFIIRKCGDGFTLTAVIGYYKDRAICRDLAAAPERSEMVALLEDILLAIDAGKNLYYIGSDDGGEEDAPMDSEE